MSSPIELSSTREGIGARLKDARQRAGLSLIGAAERLHVDPRAIEALEAERFEEFGASVYVRGHIGHYAELVGESASELQALYAGSGHVVRPPDLRRVPSTFSTARSPAPFVPGIAVVVAVALVGSIWWVAGNYRGSPKVQRPPVAAGAPGTAAAAATAATAATAGNDIPAAVIPLHAEAAVQQASAQPHATVKPRAAIVEGRAKVSALQLHFTEDSWAEVYDARGERLLFDVGSADSTRTVSGMPPLRVVLGNPTGVALQLNGRPLGVPENAARNVSIEFEINRSGRIAPARLAAADARSVPKEPGRD